MRIASWNVNGFRAVLKNGFAESYKDIGADILCLQETKMQPGQAEFETPSCTQYWNSAEKKGYSGTAVFTNPQPLNVSYGIGHELHGIEGRAITCEYEGFYLVNVYTPNAQHELKRIDYRMQWEDDLRAYLVGLDKKKPVVYCGDLNVAHNEIDIKNATSNRGHAGFSDQEREKMTQLLASGFADTFRTLYPEKVEYSWWSYRGNARMNNVGWRLDYFIVSDRLMPKVKNSSIRGDIHGSDHCPVVLDIDV